ncbi:uncharacterized protein FA14DRAFT_179933 [Meira miltonrushii]|uniref:Uncharacterized protein n=1 Tax=Meira miltonrushii TaxID=1280837 RepID=A0A316V6Q0_9BASI|nr:uncharacterized protein FA14DRAFT_179933 [Meira miltonrushii]PWN33279.1 hypothetical protein FA14DRAFT_179933 [Meira miltonrushii]
MPINWTGGKKHLPLRAKRDALIPIPLTHHMRAQRNLLHKWQTLHPHQKHSKERQSLNTSSTTDNQASRYRTSSSLDDFKDISKKELNYKRAKILAKPSWLLPFYHPAIKLNKVTEASSNISEEESSFLSYEESTHLSTTSDANKSVHSQLYLTNRESHDFTQFKRCHSVP